MIINFPSTKTITAEIADTMVTTSFNRIVTTPIKDMVELFYVAENFGEEQATSNGIFELTEEQIAAL